MEVELRREAPLPPPEPKVEEVVLRLTPDEALTICVALGQGNAGGPGHPLYNQLDRVGFGYTNPKYVERSKRFKP